MGQIVCRGTPASYCCPLLVNHKQWPCSGSFSSYPLICTVVSKFGTPPMVCPTTTPRGALMRQRCANLLKDYSGANIWHLAV